MARTNAINTFAQNTWKKARPVNARKQFHPGQRKKGPAKGGGGPENKGARSDQDANISLEMQSPSWREFESDFFGPAAPSTKPNVCGGGGFHSGDLPANAFRALGDIHGGRQ